MRRSDFPVVKDIVLIGGGHSHVAVLRSFGMSPIDGARLTLISPDVHTPYSGMLPGLIAGHYTYDEAHIDLDPLARFAGARYLQTSVDRIDPAERLIYCRDGRPPVSYDVLSINTGSTPVFAPGLAKERRVLAVKPVAPFLKGWHVLHRRLLDEPERRLGVIGGGAGGVELLLSIQHALAEEGGLAANRAPGRFQIVTRDETILATHNAKVRKAFEKILGERNVRVHSGFEVQRVDVAGVSNGEQVVELDDVIWVTGAEPPDWFAQSGLAVDDRGFIAVDHYLRSTSHPEIFGAGDAVSIAGDPRPKSGVFAVRQGPALAQNLRAMVLGQPLERYRPQKAFLSLISTGDKYAVASRARWFAKGKWVWTWKDRIDRAFMQKFNELPPMSEVGPKSIPTVADVPPEVAAFQAPDAMRCAGCGAKVGELTLRAALEQAGLRPDTGAGEEAGSIVLGIGDDAAAFAVPEGKLLVQSTDGFPAMIDDPYVFGRIAANHALGDLFAMAATPHSALVNVTLPFAAAAKRQADLVHLMAGIARALGEAGCPIIGGHTSGGW